MMMALKISMRAGYCQYSTSCNPRQPQRHNYWVCLFSITLYTAYFKMSGLRALFAVALKEMTSSQNSNAF